MKGAWDLMEDWVKAQGPIVRFRILGTHGVVVADPLALKRIFQVRCSTLFACRAAAGFFHFALPVKYSSIADPPEDLSVARGASCTFVSCCLCFTCWKNAVYAALVR